jgi:pimeloyl-ACP methyl ester carboxylesterase
MSASSRKSVKLFAATLEVSYVEYGTGRPYLLLHGGAGSATLASLANGLSKDARAIVPTHPGFNGEPRPEWFVSIEHITLGYLDLVDRLDLRDVVVVGNSAGGWIAAEMALRNSPRISKIVLLDAVGIDTGSLDKKIVDPTGLPLEETLKLSFHDPARFAFAPPNPDAAKIRVNNQRTLRIYSGPLMHDPTLRTRLADISCPVLVLWGDWMV